MSKRKSIIILLVAVLGIPVLFAQHKGAGIDRSETAINPKSPEDHSTDLITLKVTHDLNTREVIPLTSGKKRAFHKGLLWDRNWDISRYYPRRGTDNFINVYLGLNNYLEDGDLPNSSSILSLNPLSSWYAGINFDNITHILGPVYLDWGVGASMQDFSFENTRVRIIKGDESIDFIEEPSITGRKSKINVSYLNLHFVPTLAFGRYRAFRIGFGLYGGYKIGSHVKYKFDDINGDKQKDKIKDNWYINPFKYGFRAQVGWDFFDLFFNYDLTDLFEEDINAPRLTPVTFGVIF